ncbi:MAG TPA: serine/threonine-protein kinase [Polyangiales bacterium]|nr:serine/threonine-protein kinase [Polyangiales bacterium]
MTRRVTSVTSDTAPRPASHTPQAGDVLVGKYRVERVVGSGGMGVVFAVTNLLTDRPLAIKWLARSPAEHDSLRRFKREAKIAGRIRHPHVVDVHDIHLRDDGCFLVMELLEGESLAAFLKRSGPLPAERVCEILLPCLSAVAAAHAAHVIHRDLKPDNIFLCGEDRAHPKLLDFGISRLQPGLDAPHTTETREGTVLGTPAYMAPEQLLAAPCDARTDVYALGVTMYEMLTGVRAFEGATYAALSSKIIHGEVVPLAQRASGVPSELVDVVTRAMHRLPEERFPDVLAMEDAIRAFLHVPRAPVRAAPKRNRAVPLVVAVLGVVIAIGVTLALSRAASGKQRETVKTAAVQEVSPRVEPPPPKPAAAATPLPAAVVAPEPPASEAPRAKPRREVAKPKSQAAPPPPDDVVPPKGPTPKPKVEIDGM